jgi:hypothetical protein
MSGGSQKTSKRIDKMRDAAPGITWATERSVDSEANQSCPVVEKDDISHVEGVLINLRWRADTCLLPQDSLVQSQIQDKYFSFQDLAYRTYNEA